MDHVRKGLEIQRQRFREMTPAERWQAAHNLYWSARRLKTGWLRSQRPDWSDAEVEAEVRRVFMHARD